MLRQSSVDKYFLALTALYTLGGGKKRNKFQINGTKFIKERKIAADIFRVGSKLNYFSWEAKRGGSLSDSSRGMGTTIQWKTDAPTIKMAEAILTVVSGQLQMYWEKVKAGNHHPVARKNKRLKDSTKILDEVEGPSSGEPHREGKPSQTMTAQQLPFNEPPTPGDLHKLLQDMRTLMEGVNTMVAYLYNSFKS